MNGIEIISASAGTGKTFTISELIADEVGSGRVKPERILATTFTVKAATELVSRIRVRLLEGGLVDEATSLDGALIGTVNSVCGRLVADYAFELGLSPELGILDEDEAAKTLSQAIASSASSSEAEILEDIKSRMPSFEWIEAVKRITDAVRSNRIDPSALTELAADSVRECMAFLEAEASGEGLSEEDWDKRLDEALKRFIAQVATSDDSTGVTAGARDKAEEARHKLGKAGALQWSEWVALSLLKTSVKSQGFAQPVIEAASGYEAHPRFKSDIRTSIELCFALASRSLQGYAAYKREIGMIDFIDQERIALELLEKPEILAEISERVDLLLVDEFQDTSPIQLAVFLKLAKAAKKSVWVGDQKQAIYGFRGTDPALMDAAIATILEGTEPRTLKISYRSRAPLVEVSSALFVPPFAARGLPEERVSITASANEAKGEFGPAFERWILDSKNKLNDAKSIANGVAQLLDDSPLVRDPGNGTPRPLKMSDIAVLCRKNADCDAIAESLEALGIAASIPRSGLLETDLATLALSALQLWADNRDCLAAALIARLEDKAEDAEAWFALVLEEGSPDHPPLFAPGTGAAKIIELSLSRPNAGPLEALDWVIEALELRTLARRRGEAATRLSDLEALRAAARAYVAQSDNAGTGSTVSGLAVWLKELAGAGMDARGCGDPEGSVQVLTFHGAKGLEWPAVVLVDAGQRDGFKDALGVHVVPRAEGFDIADPLAGRAIRYWPDPFQKGSKRAAYYDRMAATAEAARCAAADEYEALRLLYVGWTRARDILILAARPGKLEDGMFGLFTKDGECLISEPEDDSALWAGKRVDCRMRECAPAEDRAAPSPIAEEYILPAAKAYPPAFIAPSSIERESARIAQSEQLHPALAVSTGRIDSSFGTALHAIFASDKGDRPAAERIASIAATLERWGASVSVSPNDILSEIDSFYAWIDRRWPGAKQCKEWPLDLIDSNSSLVRGTADYVLMTEEGFAIIDHKSYPGAFEEATDRLANYGGQLFAYATAIKAATGKPCIGTWLHFPIAGKITRVEG